MQNFGKLRRSQHINRHPAVNIHHARRFTGARGAPLNWMVTINFGLGGVEPNEASYVLQRLLAQRFAPWLRRAAVNDNDLKPTYVWSLEAPHGVVSAHLLMHLPPKLARGFRGRMTGWLKTLAGNPIPARAIHVQPIHNEVGLTRYILKGIKPAWADHLEIEPIAQGEIIGKRSGFSRNLGPSARRRAGYKPKRHLV